MKTFWDKFYELSTIKDGSPNGTAKKLAIPSGSITAWKGGSIPRPKTIQKLAAYFGVPVEFLMSDEENADSIIRNVSQYESVLAWTVQQQDVPNRVKKVIQSELPPSSMGALAALTVEEQKEKLATAVGGELDNSTHEILDLISDFSVEELALVKARIKKIKESRE